MLRNKTIVRKGIAKAKKVVESFLLEVSRYYAIKALQGAVEAYDRSESRNLTGNTRTGFTSAVYYKSQMVYGPINVLDNEAGLSVAPPTSGFVKVGSGGFASYKSGITVPYVKPYKNPQFHFIGTLLGQYAKDKTAEWLRRRTPRNDGFVVIVANCSTYVNFLEIERDFDILVTESLSYTIKQRIDEAVKRIDFEKLFEKTKR